MNLILKEQTDNVVFGDIFEYQDYEDWIKCVVEDEKRKNEQFLDATSVQVSNVFELYASSKTTGEEAHPQTPAHEDNIWT